MGKTIAEMIAEERKKREEEERKKQEEAGKILESLNNKNDKNNTASGDKNNPYSEWIDSRREQNTGGFLGGLGYLGQSILNNIAGSAEGLIDYTVGGLASLLGGSAGQKYAEDLMENDWYDYEAAEKRFNPSIGWKIAGDVAGGLGQAAFSIGTGVLVSLATGGAGLAPTLAKGIGVVADVGIDYLSGAGRSVSEAVKDPNADNAGLDYTDWLYGSGSGALEATLGQLVPAAGKLGNKVLGKTTAEMGSEITESVTKKIVKNVTSSKFTREVLGESAGEFVEESLSAYLEPYIKRATYDSDAQNATIGDVMYSGFIGALTGSVSSASTQGIQLGANTLANTKRGSDIAADSKKTANLLQNASLISDYEAKKHTGASAFESVSKQYQKVVSSLESTGGVAVTAEQKKMLGELDAYVAQAVIQPNIVNAAKGVAYNAEAYADSLNKFYKKTGANQTVTAADLTAGLDMNGDSQAFVRSVSTAMESNGALRGVVLNNAIGQLEMDSRAYADSIFGDTSISTVASQENINRFVETADEDTIKSVENTLGVDMRTVTPEILAESIIRWRDSGAAAVYEGGFRDVQDAVNTLEFIDDLPSEYDIEPNTLESIIKGGNVQTSRIKEGVTRFTHGDTDIAIIKRGEGYRIYDYKSGKVSRTLTRSELGGIVRQLRNGGKAVEVIGKLVESAEGRVQSAELDALAMKSVPEYKNLLETEKMSVRETLRRAMANGVTEEDAILFGKISAKSGMNIVALNDADYKAQVGDDSEAKYDGKNTVYINADADRSRTFSGLLGHEMWHKIFKTGKGKKLFMQAYDRLDESTRSRVEADYRKDSKKRGLDEESIKEINRDEIAAAYAEELFHNAETWDYVLSEEPSFKDRVLSFFKGANKKYSFEEGMSREAKKWLKEYKRLFNEIAAENESASNSTPKIEKLGRLDKGKLTLLGTNKEAENTLLRALNAENAKNSTITNINKENMHVSDSGERYAFTNSKSGKANDTLQDYSDELLDLIEERGDYIVDNYEKLKEVVNIAFDEPKIKATAYFGIINIATLQKIEKSIPNLPKEFDGKLFKEGKQYSVAATFDSIRHLVDDKKMTRDDVIDYLNRLADTIVDFETATFDYYTDSYGKKNNGILFKKKFDDGTMVSFDLVSNKKRSLSLVTLYLNSADYQKKKAAETPLMQKTSAHTPEARVSQPSAVSIPDSAGKSNSFDKKTSKDFKNSAESGKNVAEWSSSSTAAGGPPSPILGKAKVDDGSRKALKRGENVASELAKLKGAVSDLNIDPVNLMALSDKYFERYDGKKSRTALRIELMDAARLMADSKDPQGLDKGYEAVLRLADDLVANEKDSSGYTEQMRDIQKHVREIELRVDDRDKGDFDSYGGYQEFRKRNFGKLKLGNRGVEVDSAYAELQNLYGYDVFPEVNSIAEMADVMARVGEGAPLLRGFEGDFDKQVDATAQQIYVELAEAISKGYPGKPKPRITRADAEKYIKKLDAKYEVKVARAKAKMEERASKAEAKYEKKTETKKVQLEAEYTTDKVFSQNSVKSGFESVPEVKKLPGKECETIARDLWLELEASDSQDVRDTFILKYSVKLYDAIRNADYKAYENMTMKEKDALREKLNETIKSIVESGKKSKWAKQKDNVRGIVKLEEQVAGEIKAKIYQSLKKIDDIKKERFLAASDYKSDEFKDTLEKLTKIDWRGKFSANIAREQVKKLSGWYSEENPMFKSEDPQGLNSSSGYSQSVKNMLDMLAEGEKDFSNRELLVLSDVIDYFTELITNYDKIYLEGKWVSGENVVYDIKETLERQSKTALPASTRRMRNELMGQTVFGDPLSVMKLADVYENGIFTRYYNEWQAGEIASAAEQARLEEKYNDFFSKKENRDYLKRAETETINLHGVEVRKIDYIEYCMTLKRKQALAGIESGGIVVRNAMKKGDGENVKIYPVNMIEKGPGYENRLETAVNAEYQRAIKKLSSKDLEYMKILEEGYELAREVKALGDLQRQGFVSVVEGYYYPIRRAYSDHLSEFDAAAFATDKYANAGFNKRQAADSNGALKIGSADDTFHRHIRGVSGYLHLSPVMDSFNKVYKLKVLKTRPGEGASIDLINDLKSMRNSTTSLQQLIDQSKTTWRDKDGTSVGFKYLQELMLDTMGKVPSGKLDEYAAKLRGGYVKFALGGNPKVLLTQLSSLMASTSVISKWSHVAGVLNSTANVDNYSIVAKLRYGDNTVLKAQGVIDTVNSKTDVFMKGIELFDRFVIKRAFAACQAEVAKTQGLKVGTEENLKAAGKLLDKVILETQQNSFASSKTAAARRGGALAKTLQMFKSDAVKITARILDAWGERAYLQTVLDSKEVSEDQKTKLRARLKDVNKNLGDAIVAAVMQAVYMGVVAELFRAIYGKLEKEEEPLEKAKRLGAEFLGNLIGGLPFYAELFSALTSSFSNIEAMEFSAINDLISTVNKVINTVGNAVQGEADFKEYVKMLESVTYSAGQILGIPFRNLKNVLSIPLNFLSDEARYRWDDIFDSKNYGADLKDAVAAGDLDLAVTILELAFKDGLGSGLSKKAINELARLTGIRDDMLPSAVGDTVTIDGEERELTGSEMNAIRDRYSDAVEQINKFIEGGFYDNLSDEDRAAAIKKIYTLYKELAIDTVLGTEKDKKAMILSKVVPAEALVLWEVAKVIDSDKDEDGNTVYGSKKKNLIEAIMAEQLSYEEKLLLIGMSDLTLNGGDIEGVTGIEARTTLYNCISSLENISDEERGELLKYCGFEDRDDNGTIDEPLPSDINNSYKSDLKDAVESGDTKSAEDIISLAVRENLGVDISKEAVKEIARLAATGKNVLPSVIEDSVKIGGKERELTAAEYKAAMKKYSVAAAEVDKLISSNIYKGLSDEQKASAVGSVFEMFRNIAYDSTLGTNKNAKAHVLSKVLPSSSLVIWDVAGAIDSDRDENGYTIDGSRKKNIIDAVMSESLSYEEKLLIIGANGCRINGGDIEGVTGFEARLTIYNYISKLKDISNEERYALYDLCGFVNDEGVLREPIPADIDTSYKKDLEEAISAGDAKSAENIVSLAIRESMGTEIGKGTINEIVRLTGLGKNVLPTAISDKISYNGKTRELTVDEYKTVFAKASVASAQVEKLIESDVYKSLNDDQRASVVNSVFDMFKDIAYDTTLGTQKNVKAATLSKVVDPDALVLWKCSGVFEADRDENGKAISGSKKAKIVNAIWNSDIPEIHRLLLIGMNGYKIDDDDIPGLTGFEAQTALYNYIASLENLSEEERLELYKECGFEIEGGTALAPVEGSSSGSSSSSKSSGSKTIKKIGWVLGGGSMIGSMHGADYTKKIVKLGKARIK